MGGRNKMSRRIELVAHYGENRETILNGEIGGWGVEDPHHIRFDSVWNVKPKYNKVNELLESLDFGLGNLVSAAYLDGLDLSDGDYRVEIAARVPDSGQSMDDVMIGTPGSDCC